MTSPTAPGEKESSQHCLREAPNEVASSLRLDEDVALILPSSASAIPSTSAQSSTPNMTPTGAGLESDIPSTAPPHAATSNTTAASTIPAPSPLAFTFPKRVEIEQALHPDNADKLKLQNRKRLIQQTWRAVENGLDVNATRAFYVELFASYPSVRPLFEVAGTDMESQAHKLYEVLQVAVRFLDNMECIVPVLKDLGIQHARHYGVLREHYEAVTLTFIKVLNQFIFKATSTTDATNLGISNSLWMMEVADAWNWVLGVIGGVMADAADEAGIQRGGEEKKEAEEKPSGSEQNTATEESEPMEQ